MSELLRLISHPVVARLGLALVQFAWQGAALAVLAAGLLIALRRAPAGARYLILLGVLAAMAACPVITFLATPRPPAVPAPPAVIAAPEWVETTPPAPVAPRAATMAPPAGFSPRAASSVPAPRPLLTARARAWVIGHLAWIGLLWIAGVVALSLRFLVRGWAVWRIGRRLEAAEAHWQDLACSLARRLAMRRPVRLLVSAAAQVPLVVGWLRPAIVVPTRALTGLTPEQLTALLAHELAHLRRGDQWVNLAQSVIELLLFYHPAVWWVSRAIRAEREHCCDDIAVTLSGDVAGYIRALAWVETNRGRRLQPALAASGSPLLKRIRRLAGRPSPELRSTWLAPALALLVVSSLLLAGLVSAAIAQTAAGHRPGLRDQWMPQTEHDPRLQQPVHIEIIGRAASAAMKLLSDATGVSLGVTPEDMETVGERKLTIIAQGCSLKALLVQIPKALQECHVDIDLSGKEPRYLLHRNGSPETIAAELEKAEIQRRQEAHRADREARLDAARKALAMSPEELAELAKTDPLLAAMAKDAQARKWAEMALSLPADKLAEFTDTGRLTMGLTSAPSAIRQGIGDWIQASTHDAARREAQDEYHFPWVQLWQVMQSKRDQLRLLCLADTGEGPDAGPTDGIFLGIDTYVDTGRHYMTTHLAIPPRNPVEDRWHDYRNLLMRTGTPDAQAADAVLSELAKRHAQEALEARDRSRAEDWREPRSPALHRSITLPAQPRADVLDVQKEIAAATGLSLVSDYYTRWYDKEIPEEARATMPVWRLLYLLSEQWFWSYEWDEAGDCLVFHDRYWYRQPVEAPESLVTDLRTKLKQQGGLTLDDVAGAAVALSRVLARNGKAPAGTMAVDKATHNVVEEPAMPHDLTRSGLYWLFLRAPQLLLYGSLTPEQRAQARTPQGIPFAALTVPQQALIRRSATWPSRDRKEFAVTEQSIAQTVFRVTQAPRERYTSEGANDACATGWYDVVNLEVVFPGGTKSSQVYLAAPAPSGNH